MSSSADSSKPDTLNLGMVWGHGDTTYFTGTAEVQGEIDKLLSRIPGAGELAPEMLSLLERKKLNIRMFTAPLSKLDSKEGVLALLTAVGSTEGIKPYQHDKAFRYDLAMGMALQEHIPELKKTLDTGVKTLWAGQFDTLPVYAFWKTMYGKELPLVSRFIDKTFAPPTRKRNAHADLSLVGTMNHLGHDVAHSMSRGILAEQPLFISDIVSRKFLESVAPLTRKEQRAYDLVVKEDERGRDAAGKGDWDGAKRQWGKILPAHQAAVEDKPFFSFNF